MNSSTTFETELAEAIAAFQAVEPLARQVASPQYILPRARGRQIQSLIRLGQPGHARQVLDGLAGQDRDHPEIRIAEIRSLLAGTRPSSAPALGLPVLSVSQAIPAPLRWCPVHSR